MDNRDVGMIYIDPEKPNKYTLGGMGHLYFYRKNDTQFTMTHNMSYIGEASVYGAIFSETGENFECNMIKGFKRMNILSEIYIDRISSLIEHYSNVNDPTNCRMRLEQANITLTEMSNIEIYNSTNIDLLYGLVEDLKMQNKVIQKYSCPVIY
jgi:hypothetical protein